MTNRNSLVAPCGIDCFYCELYGSNMTAPMKNMVSMALKIPVDDVVPCKGCREQKGCLLYPDCETYKCIKEKSLDFCHECSEFPCVRLHPAADRAEKLPHNLKVYNLCRIKAIGLDKWIAEESLESKKRYYLGKIVVGDGPKMNKWFR